MIDSEGSERATFGADDYVSGRAAAEAAGRYVVTFADDADDADRDHTLRSVAGVRNVTSTRDFDARVMDLSQTVGADAVVLSRLGVAIVTAAADQVAALWSTRRILSIRPSRVHRTLSESGSRHAQLRAGRRDEVTKLYSKLASGTNTGTGAAVAETYRDTDQFIWGLQATGASASRCTGRGVKVAVLDTGFDLNHPDFADRGITAQSFVSLPDPRRTAVPTGWTAEIIGLHLGPDRRSSPTGSSAEVGEQLPCNDLPPGFDGTSPCLQ